MLLKCLIAAAASLISISEQAQGDTVTQNTSNSSRALNRYQTGETLGPSLEDTPPFSDSQLEQIDQYQSNQSTLDERIDWLDQTIHLYEDSPSFSTTTKFSGQTTFVLGSNAFLGDWNNKINRSQSIYGGTSFNYDTKLELETSFTGQDLLYLRFRAGNFDGRTNKNTFGGGGPTVLSQLEVAFQEGEFPGKWAINRAYYRFPLGDLTFTLGPRVGQENLMAIYPSRYPSETLLDLMTMGGGIGANDMNLGSGLSVWWKNQNLALTALHVSRHANSADTRKGGIIGPNSASSTSLQLGYETERWSLISSFTYANNAPRIMPYGTPLVMDSITQQGTTRSFALTANWSPQQPGWIPVVTAGWGLNQTSYRHETTLKQDQAKGRQTLVNQSQSWSVGLGWDHCLIRGNQAGLAVGQPIYATTLLGGEPANDTTYIWEAWYRFRISDSISITPGAFYISRPFGQQTPRDKSFSQLGALIKTTFSL